MKKNIEKYALEKTRKWIQWNCKNGNTVTWGSGDILNITVRQLEDFAIKLIKEYKSEKEKPVLNHFYSRNSY